MKNLSIVAVETRPDHVQRVLKILEHSQQALDAAESVLVTGQGLELPATSVRVLQTPISIKNNYDYSLVLLNGLPDWFSHDHCLIVQHDGFVVNPQAWTDEFLDYDYIGAPWFHLLGLRIFDKHPPITLDNAVGNGGFSLRSKNLCSLVRERVQQLSRSQGFNPQDLYPEDNFVCLTLRKFLTDLGCKFAPIQVASRFSVENAKYAGQLGFHGPWTIALNQQLGVFN